MMHATQQPHPLCREITKRIYDYEPVTPASYHAVYEEFIPLLLDLPTIDDASKIYCQVWANLQWYYESQRVDIPDWTRLYVVQRPTTWHAIRAAYIAEAERRAQGINPVVKVKRANQ